MSGPNLDAKLEILVCDDSNWIVEGLVPLLQKKFGGESFAKGNLTRLVEEKVFEEGMVNIEGDRINLTWVKDLDYVVREVRAHKPPHYSLIIYGAQHFRDKKVVFSWGRDDAIPISVEQSISRTKGVRNTNLDQIRRRLEINFNGEVCDSSRLYMLMEDLGYKVQKIEGGEIQKGGRAISNVRRVDPFVPQMIVGKGIEEEDLMKAARAGCLYYAKRSSSVESWLDKLFREPSLLPKCTVIKLGGSSFDYVRQTRSRNLKEICDALTRIFIDRPGKKNRRETVNRFIVTVGAGQYGDIEKEDLLIHDGDPGIIEAFPERMAEALIANSKSIHIKMGGEHSSLISTGNFYFVSKEETRNKIPIMPLAPHYVSARDQIPLQDSDTHTIALAEFYGAERVVLIKRTDGIYDHDPYLGFVLGPTIRKCRSVDKWVESQKGNKRHKIVNVEDMLKGNISRIGTNFDVGEFDGSTGHLMEDSALEYFKYCSKVKEILVVHIAPEEMHYQVGENEYKHVITGETLQLGPAGWQGVMEQRLRDAFQGMAASKIVR